MTKPLDCHPMVLRFPEIQICTSQVEIVFRSQQEYAFSFIIWYSSSETKFNDVSNKLFFFLTLVKFSENLSLLVSSPRVHRGVVLPGMKTGRKRNHLWHNIGRLGSMECRSSKRRGMWRSHTKLNRDFIFRANSLSH